MHTTFILNGGIGRVIASIPALEKFHRLNPDDDFRIVVGAWDQIFWSHPVLQNRVYLDGHRGVFEQVVRHGRIVVPEPYHLHSFYNQKTNLAQAFDEIINDTTDHSDLGNEYLYLSEYENRITRAFVAEARKMRQKKRVIVLQPFGSSAEVTPQGLVADRTNRSLGTETYLEIVRRLSEHASIVYLGAPHLRSPSDNVTIPIDEQPVYLRIAMGLIRHCDYYIGICSVGQHIARAFDRPGTVIMGATHENNFSYRDHFRIYRRADRQPVYMPWRISEHDSAMADRLNDGIMDLTNDDIDKICDPIIEHLNALPNNQDPDFELLDPSMPGCSTMPPTAMPMNGMPPMMPMNGMPPMMPMNGMPMNGMPPMMPMNGMPMNGMPPMGPMVMMPGGMPPVTNVVPAMFESPNTNKSAKNKAKKTHA